MGTRAVSSWKLFVHVNLKGKEKKSRINCSILSLISPTLCSYPVAGFLCLKSKNDWEVNAEGPLCPVSLCFSTQWNWAETTPCAFGARWRCLITHRWWTVVGQRLPSHIRSSAAEIKPESQWVGLDHATRIKRSFQAVQRHFITLVNDESVEMCHKRSGLSRQRHTFSWANPICWWGGASSRFRPVPGVPPTLADWCRLIHASPSAVAAIWQVMYSHRHGDGTYRYHKFSLHWPTCARPTSSLGGCPSSVFRASRLMWATLVFVAGLGPPVAN